MKKSYTLLILLLCFFYNTHAQTKIAANEISKHINDSVTTSNKIYGGRVLDRSQLTILYVGGVFPEHLFTIVIKEPARSYFAFKSPDNLKGKNIWVTGRVTEYGGKPQILVTDHSQIKIE